MRVLAPLGLCRGLALLSGVAWAGLTWAQGAPVSPGAGSAAPAPAPSPQQAQPQPPQQYAPPPPPPPAAQQPAPPPLPPQQYAPPLAPPPAAPAPPPAGYAPPPSPGPPAGYPPPPLPGPPSAPAPLPGQPEAPAAEPGKTKLQENYTGMTPASTAMNPLPKPNMTGGGTKLVWTGFQMTGTGSRVFFQTVGPLEYDIKPGKNSLGVILHNTRIHLRNNGRHLDTRFFATPVRSVASNQRRKDVEVRIALKEAALPNPRVDVGPEGTQFLVLDFPPGKADDRPKPGTATAAGGAEPTESPEDVGQAVLSLGSDGTQLPPADAEPAEKPEKKGAGKRASVTVEKRGKRGGTMSVVSAPPGGPAGQPGAFTPPPAGTQPPPPPPPPPPPQPPAGAGLPPPL